MRKLAAEQHHQLLAEGQSNAEAAVLAGHGAVELIEAPIDQPVRRRGKADAGVRDLDAQRQAAIDSFLAADIHTDAATAGELDGIVQQVAQGLGQLAGVTLEDVRQALVEFHMEGQPLLLRTRAVLHPQAVRQAAQAERLPSRV
ncbi:hypothetical protein D9M68_406230 [compost metagenome]